MMLRSPFPLVVSRQVHRSAAAAGHVFILAAAAYLIAGLALAADSLGVLPPEPAPMIDSVEIRTENIFDLSDARYKNLLFRLANRYHRVTRQSVVAWEMLLHQGDFYDTLLAQESARNLRSLPYLLKTEIRMRKGERGENIMSVTTSDKWSTAAGLSFHRSGGRNDVQLSLQESNLLGLGIFLSQNFYILDHDHNFYQGELRNNRIWGKAVAGEVNYSDNPDAGRLAFSLNRPFYSLAQKWSGEVNYGIYSSRSDYYYRQALVARDRVTNRTIQVNAKYRIGPEYFKYYFMALYTYVDNRSRPRLFYDTDSVVQHQYAPVVPQLPGDSIYHHIQGTIGLQQVKYRVYRRLNRFDKPEDINLGLDLRVSAGTARAVRGSPFQYYLAYPQYTMAYRAMLLNIGAAIQRWMRSDHKLRHDFDCHIKWYWQYHAYHTFVVGARYRSDRLREKSYTLYMDEDNGLRGYPVFYAGGEDRLIVNAENRIFPNLEILSVGIGGVVFADIGNVWSRGETPMINGFRYAVGFGLRLGITRSTHAEVMRLDLAYAPHRHQWQISVGTGQFF